MDRRRSGMTLIEVILATVILGICMLSLMQGISACVEVFNASAFIHEAANVLSRGEAEYPMIIQTDPEVDLVVDSDSKLVEGWTFERAVDEDEDEDGLFVVKTKVVKGQGGLGMEQEFVRLIYYSSGAKAAGATADK